MSEQRRLTAAAATPDAGTGVTSYLLAGPLGFGAIGFGIDRWLGTPFFVAVGALAGMALALYVIWLRYGGTASESPAQHDGQTPADGAVTPEPQSGTPALRSTNEEKM